MTQWSKEQAACIYAASHDEKSYVVTSCAGSGKTTTGVEMVSALPQTLSIVNMAFNTRIAEELNDRMPGYTTNRTFHSIGRSAWGKRLGKYGKPDQWKMANIRRDLGYDSETFPDFSRIIGMAKARGLVPKGAPGGMKGLEEDTPEWWLDLIHDQGMDCGECEQPVPVLREALTLSIKKAWKSEIDFDDMIYMPAIYQGEFPDADVVMVDEVQDVSAIQRKMVQCMNPKRVFALGDPHQAIYGFRGADYTSVDAFLDEFRALPLQLTVSFRCPQAVVQEAQRWVTHMLPHPNAPEGSVKRLRGWGPGDLQPGDVILCRNNRPLLGIAFDLIRQGVGARVLGRDIGEGLKSLVKRECKETNSLKDCINLLVVYLNSKKESMSEAAWAYLEDKVEAIVLVSDKLLSMDGSSTKKTLIDTLDRMFAKENKPITLSTIHKAKGMEWRRVFFLDDFLIPSKRARTDSQLQQEYNLSYVGVTRAKQALYYVDSGRFV